MLCITMIVGGYVLLPVASECPAPHCHPAVRIEETWKPPQWGDDMAPIVDTRRLYQLQQQGWRWVEISERSPFASPHVCLSQPKEK